VLDSCFYQAGLTPTAQNIADIVISLDVTPSQLQLLTPNMASFLEPYGVPYQEPTTVVNGDTAVTTFFANDFQLVGVFQVTVTRTGESPVVVDYTDLS